MNIVPSLQVKVNRIVDGSTSFNDVVDVGILRQKAEVAYVLRFMNALEFNGVLLKTDGEFDALIAVVVWQAYLSSLSRYRIVCALRSVGMDAQADNFARCGLNVYNLKCCHCGYVHEVEFHCKLRVCRSCGVTRQYEMVDAWRDGLLSIGELRFVTLTLKNVVDLDAGVKKIRSCFTKLRHRKYYVSRIYGGLYAIECPVGKDGLWNVHLHFVYGGRYIPQPKLADDWEKITGDSRVVDIRKVKCVDRSVRYLVKYACKVDVGAMVADGKLGEYMSALYNVRLVQAFGTLLGRRTVDDTLFLCPECGECVWRVVEAATGYVVFDGLEYIRSRASPMF